MTTLMDALKTAVGHHQSGNFPEAERIYRAILQVNPDEPNALNLLGLLAHQTHHLEDAISLFVQAAKASPDSPEIQTNLGKALTDAGKEADAEAAFQRAISLFPNHAEAYFHLGNARLHNHDLEAALACFERAVAASPDYVEAIANQGLALLELDRLEPAEVCFRRAIALRPENVEALVNLGNLLFRKAERISAGSSYLKDIGQRPVPTAAAKVLCEEAISTYRSAVSVNPNQAEAFNNLGNLLLWLGRREEAIDALNKAVLVRPDYAEAHNTLGSALVAMERYEAAITAFETAAGINPGLAEAHINLGTVYLLSERLGDAMRSFEKALEVDPLNAEAIYNLGRLHYDTGDVTKAKVFFHKATFDVRAPTYFQAMRLLTCEVLDPEATNETIFETAKAVAATAAFDNDLPTPVFGPRDGSRRPRIGFHYSGFNTPSGRWGMLPVFTGLSRDQFDTFFYGDPLPEPFRSEATFRDTLTVGDREFMETVLADDIDILIDLEGHMPGYRYKALWRRVAPVQACAGNYMCTSGLPTMDYFITEENFTPPEADRWHCETVIRLNSARTPVMVEDGLPPLRPPPCLENGYVSFGYFGHLQKVNDRLLDAWSRILAAVPGSRLLVMGDALGNRGTRDLMARRMEHAGLAVDRVTMGGRVSYTDYLDILQEQDMVLDSFPYTGGHTVIEAMKYGVSLLSMKGETFVSNAGAYTLTRSGLPELVVGSVDDYVDGYIGFARNPDRLSAYRTQLREKLRTGSLGDLKAIIRAYEACLTDIWTTFQAR